MKGLDNYYSSLCLGDRTFVRAISSKILNRERNKIMSKYVCSVCGYEYDPETGDPDNNIEPGTEFADIPEDWVCPVCGAEKENFESTD